VLDPSRIACGLIDMDGWNVLLALALVACCVDDTFRRKKMVVAPECMLVAPGKIAGTGGTQHVVPIRGTRNWCLNVIGGAMSQQFPGNFPDKLPGDFLRTPS